MKKILALLLALFVIAPGAGYAEKFTAPEYGFSINPAAGWKQIPQNFQGGLVSYHRDGTTALFHVTVRDMDEAKSATDLEWADLFHPQFEEIAIGTEGETAIGGQPAKYCTYRIRPGEFKKKMEGKIPAKYINYVIIYKGKLFSVTFVDTFDYFSLDYSSFLEAVRTIQFTEPVAPPPAEPETAEEVEQLVLESKKLLEGVES